MRTGILSDDYIMKNVCVEYRPVPLGKVGDILTPEMKPKHGLELRAAKYVRPPVRPATFQAMSNSLSNQADPTNPLPVQQQLAKQYEQELELAHVFPPPLQEVLPDEQGSDSAPESDDDDYPDFTNPFRTAMKQMLKEERKVTQQEAEEQAQEQAQQDAPMDPLDSAAGMPPMPTFSMPTFSGGMLGSSEGRQSLAEGLKAGAQIGMQGGKLMAQGLYGLGKISVMGAIAGGKALQSVRQSFAQNRVFPEGGSSKDIEEGTQRSTRMNADQRMSMEGQNFMRFGVYNPSSLIAP
jgi:hypothetical protein